MGRLVFIVIHFLTEAMQTLYSGIFRIFTLYILDSAAGFTLWNAQKQVVP